MNAQQRKAASAVEFIRTELGLDAQHLQITSLLAVIECECIDDLSELAVDDACHAVRTLRQMAREKPCRHNPELSRSFVILDHYFEAVVYA